MIQRNSEIPHQKWPKELNSEQMRKYTNLLCGKMSIFKNICFVNEFRAHNS